MTTETVAGRVADLLLFPDLKFVLFSYGMIRGI